jgi:hypothetical protein
VQIKNHLKEGLLMSKANIETLLKELLETTKANNEELRGISATLKDHGRRLDALESQVKDSANPKPELSGKKSTPKKTASSKVGKVWSQDRPTVYKAMGCRLRKDGVPYKGDYEKCGGRAKYEAKAKELGLWHE